MRNSIVPLFVIALLFGIAGVFTWYGKKETFTAKVKGKERIVESQNNTLNSYYLIYTSNGVFKLEDDLFYGNFRSSDTYGNLDKDSTYTFTTVGYRVGVLSMYPNIVSVTKK